jgi:4-amino-4-deoxy-L-arabinose transferase-like glycosyltransferase
MPLATVRSDVPSLAIAALALAILATGKVGPVWLIGGGASIGLLRLVLGVP